MLRPFSYSISSLEMCKKSLSSLIRWISWRVVKKDFNCPGNPDDHSVRQQLLYLISNEFHYQTRKKFHCSSLTRNFKDPYSLHCDCEMEAGSIQANTQFFHLRIQHKRLALSEIFSTSLNLTESLSSRQRLDISYWVLCYAFPDKNCSLCLHNRKRVFLRKHESLKKSHTWRISDSPLLLFLHIFVKDIKDATKNEFNLTKMTWRRSFIILILLIENFPTSFVWWNSLKLPVSASGTSKRQGSSDSNKKIEENYEQQNQWSNKK